MTRLPANTSAVDVYDMPFTLVQGDKFWFQQQRSVVKNGEPVTEKYGKLRSGTRP